jgi:hypothetical protein
MNQTQQKYLLKRLDEIKLQLICNASNKYKTKAVKINDKEKYKLIKSGVVKFNVKKLFAEIKCKKNYYGVDTLYWPVFQNGFDFSKYFKEEKTDLRYGLTVERIDAEYTRLSDELILGDSDKALKAINKFANFKI